VQPADIEKVSLRIANGFIRIRYPAGSTLASGTVQTAIQAGLITAYRKEAKACLPQRVRLLAESHGFSYRKVTIKNHKSRWGSCSAVNNINLSLHLMRLPDDLVDYVILHELVHTEIKNHSPAFWHRLEQICPGTRALRRRLRSYETGGLTPLVTR